MGDNEAFREMVARGVVKDEAEPAPVKKKKKKPIDSKYRDRAEERRQGINPDYATELEGMIAMGYAEPGEPVDVRRAAIDYLEEDMRLTSGVLKEEDDGVKGLEKALGEAEARVAAVMSQIPQTSTLGRSLEQRLFPPSDRVVSAFLPGRSAYVFDLDLDASTMPSTLQRSRADWLPVPDMVPGHLSQSALDDLSEVMSSLRKGRRRKRHAPRPEPAKRPALQPVVDAPAPVVDDDDDIYPELSGAHYQAEATVTAPYPSIPERQVDDDIYPELSGAHYQAEATVTAPYPSIPERQVDDDIYPELSGAHYQAEATVTAPYPSIPERQPYFAEEPDDLPPMPSEETAKRRRFDEEEVDHYAEAYPAAFDLGLSDDEEEGSIEIVKQDKGKKQKKEVEKKEKKLNTQMQKIHDIWEKKKTKGS